ncbi:MAG: putative drug exporter of the superfamily [Gaiellaceae bacterium]|jgi:RND superfamily putative drug exporter|nr:putative drug exporter of the superfamily [Gaiellaceae bacterium]
MERLAHYVVHHRRIVIGVWILLTAFGAFSSSQVANRWLEDFSIPDAPGYEADQRAVAKLGNGELFPFVLVFRADGDVTKVPGVETAIEKVSAANPGSRVSSFFNTGDDAYVSHDRKVTFANVYAVGKFSFEGVDLKPTKEALAAAVPEGVDGYVTGIDSLVAESSKTAGGGEPPSILFEFLIGLVGALVILLFTFGTLPAVAMPLAIAIASILNTFSLIWLLTYITDVSIVVQFLVALVGLGVAVDYALLVVFRFREELRHGADRDAAVVQTMKHAGRSVIVSGSTVAVGLLSMVILPLPFIRSIGIGGMLIPAVSVLAAITLLPALLYTLGPRINRLRVLPRRIVEGSDDPEKGFWNRWAHLVVRRPVPIAATGLAIVAALLFYGIQLNPADAQAKDFPGGGPAHQGAQVLRDAGITEGVHKPFQIAVEGDATPAQLEQVAARLDETDGIAGASAPPQARADGFALVEAFSTSDGSSRKTRPTITRLKDDVLPAAEAELGGAQLTLAGLPTSEREFIDAAYGNFPYVLLFVVLLTYVLLVRAFRSVLLPLKAVILNLVSLGAAYGIIVLIFQKGHGSEAIWNVPATDSIISWIPLMIFAFLYGLSMDYEVFMLTRMREAYDETGDTAQAISLGLARTGKLVTSAALVLMFSFFVLSTQPGTDIKQFGIGLAAGIIFDATVIRALLVPSIMRLMGDWNWWLPSWAARILRVSPSSA